MRAVGFAVMSFLVGDGQVRCGRHGDRRVAIVAVAGSVG